MLRSKATIEAIRAERARRELDYERGRYMLTEAVQQEWRNVLGDFLQTVETSLPDLANTLQLDREGIVKLRRWWRQHRADAARANRDKAAALSQFIEDPDPEVARQ